MSGRGDWVVVVPPAGEGARVARELLALAEHSGHVRTQGGGQEFLVPQYLADLYTKPPADEAPKPRRRSRKEGGE